MAVDLGSVGSVFVDVEANLDPISQQMASVSAQAEQSGKQIGEHIHEGISPGVHEAEEEVGGLKEGLLEMAEVVGVAFGLEAIAEGLIDIAKESLEAYGNVQLVTSSLTYFTGSGEATEEMLGQLHEIAQTSTNDFIGLAKAAQKMAGLGVDTESIVPALQALSDGSMVTGKSFDGMESAAERVFLTGTLNARTLSSIGVSMSELADTMGVSVDEVKDDFTALGPQSEAALQFLVTTVQNKFHDAAQAMQGDLPISINKVKDQWDILLEDFGKDLAPSLGTLLTTVQEVFNVFHKISAEVEAISQFKLAGVSLGDLVSSNTSLGQMKALLDGVNSALGDNSSKTKDAKDALDKKTLADQEQNEKLEKAKEDLAAHKTAQEAATQAAADAQQAQTDLNAAYGLVASSLKSSYVPVITGLEIAQRALTTAESENAQGIANVVTARDNLAIAIGKFTANSAAAHQADLDLQEAERQHADTTDTLDKAKKNYNATLTSQKDITKDITDAEKTYIAAQNQDLIPAIMSVIDAEDTLAKLKADKLPLMQDELDKQWALSAAANDYARNSPEVVQAEQDLSDARVALDDNTKKITDTTKLLATARKDELTASHDLSEAEQLLATTYQQLYPTTKDLTGAVGDLTDARDREKASAQLLTQALIDYNGQVALFGANSPQAIAAHGALKIAQDNLKTSANDTKQAEADLSTQFGLSKEAAKLLGEQADTTKTSQDLLNDALKATGQKTLPDLKTALEVAKTAYGDIAEGGGSYSQVLQAHINLMQKQIDLWTGSGETVPASAQIGLAALKQAEVDYQTDAVTRWSTTWQGIHDSLTGTIHNMENDLIQGDWVKFRNDWQSAWEGIAASVLNAFITPVEHAITTFIATSLTDLITGTGSLSTAWTTLGTNITHAIGLIPTGGIAGPLGGAVTPGINGTMPNIPYTPPTIAPPSGGSSGGGGIAGALGGVGGAINVVTGAISAVADVLGLFGVGQEGQKDRLNIIANETAMMQYALYGAGAPYGIFFSNADIMETLHNFDTGTFYWMLKDLDLISDSTDSIHQALVHLDITPVVDAVVDSTATVATTLATTSDSVEQTIVAGNAAAQTSAALMLVNSQAQVDSIRSAAAAQQARDLTQIQALQAIGQAQLSQLQQQLDLLRALDQSKIADLQNQLTLIQSTNATQQAISTAIGNPDWLNNPWYANRATPATTLTPISTSGGVAQTVNVVAQFGTESLPALVVSVLQDQGVRP